MKLPQKLSSRLFRWCLEKPGVDVADDPCILWRIFFSPNLWSTILGKPPPEQAIGHTRLAAGTHIANIRLWPMVQAGTFTSTL